MERKSLLMFLGFIAMLMFAKIIDARELIAFSSNITGTGEIWVCDTNGANLEQITNNNSDAAYPAWSPDGKEIAFRAMDENGVYQVYAINYRTRAIRQITDVSSISSQAHFPSWSPDGSIIAYGVLDEAGGGTLWDTYLIDSNASHGIGNKILDNKAFRPNSWSPDGTKLCASAFTDGFGFYTYDFVVFNADGTGYIRRDLGGYESVMSPDAWSINDEILIWANFNSVSGYDLYKVNPDGTGLTAILIDQGRNGVHAGWYDNGNKIAFVSESSGNQEIWKINRDRTGLQQLTFFNTDSKIFGLSITNNIEITINSKTVPPATTPSAKTNRNQGCSTGSPFFVESGNYFHSHKDIFIHSRGIPINITRHYNTQDLYDGPFGHGWNIEYSTQLIQNEIDGTSFATVRKGNGLRIKFTDNGDGTYSPPLGNTDTLIKNPDGTFTLNGLCGSCTRKPLPAYHFNANGSLASIKDLNGNTLTIGYDGYGRIASITDANARSITFTYGSNGRVETITDFSNPQRTWTYSYDENDNLTSVTDPASNVIQYHYDDEHNLTSIIDARGKTISTINYDSNDKVTSFTDKAGTYNMAYDPVAKLTEKTDPASKVFQFNYDQNGNITNKLDPKGNTLSLTWDANINVSAKTNSRGIKTAYTYDSRGNILSVTRDAVEGGLNLDTYFEYDPRFDKIIKITDPRGNITNMVYDENGNLEERQGPQGTTHYSYDAYGNLTQVTDPDGYITAMDYDSNGYLTRFYIPGTTPLIETTYTHDERGNILTKTDPNVNTITYEYNGIDQLKLVRDPLNKETRFDYDEAGNLILIIDPLLQKTKFVYDDYGQLTKRIDTFENPAYQRETNYNYDPKGNLTSITDPLSHTTTYEYDELNQLVKVIDHLTNDWIFTYDESGNLKTKTDPNDNVTQYSYDAANRLESVTDAENHTWTYHYDENGNLKEITDANLHPATRNIYNADNRIETVKDALDYTSNYTYTPGGRIQTKTDARGIITTYIYQPLTGRLEKIQYTGGREETFAYDRTGNITSVNDNQTGASVNYTYDELNRIETETQLGQTITYTYDEVGNRETMNVPGVGLFSYTYDPLNRLKTLTNHLSQTTQYQYYANDLRQKITYSNGSFSEYTYDEVNRLTSIMHRKSDNSVIASYSYTYDNMNNRLSMTDHNGDTVSYSYDKTYKLTSAAYPDETITYSYDPVGNRLSMIDASGTYNYNYDAADRLTDYSGPASLLVEYSYDQNGNINSMTVGTDTTQYSYDEKDQLRQISYPDTSTNQYTYDPTGRRMRTLDSLGIRRFLYDGQNPLADITGDDATPVFSLIYAPSLQIDDLVSMSDGTYTYYYLKDGLKSVNFLLSTDENILGTYKYNPYGSIRNKTGPMESQFVFTSRRNERDSELLYYRSRYYDHVTGRFTKKDSFKGTLDNPLSLHRFAYVRNNPVNYTDPYGLLSLSEIWEYIQERREIGQRNMDEFYQNLLPSITVWADDIWTAMEDLRPTFLNETSENIHQFSDPGPSTPIRTPDDYLEQMYHGERLSYDRWKNAQRANPVWDAYNIAEPYMDAKIENDQEKLLNNQCEE